MSESSNIMKNLSENACLQSTKVLSDSVDIKEELASDDILLFPDTEFPENSKDEFIHNLDAIADLDFDLPEFEEEKDHQLQTEYTEQLSTFEDNKEISEAVDCNSPEQAIHFVKYNLLEDKPIKVYKCGICSKEFGHQYTLLRHVPTHTDERKFHCTACGKAFRQMSTLSQHRAIHSAERPYTCEVCQKTFNRVSTLISHRKTHTGLKAHCCYICNKAFHQKGNLRNHIFTHTNERPYKCDLCNKGFNQMSNLMCHKMKVHQRTDKPNYACNICGKEFQKRMGLINHEQYQHGIHNSESSTSPPNNVKCPNGIVVGTINTAAMRSAVANNQIPFALLKPANGIPILVRVVTWEEQQMVVPVTAEELKTFGNIGADLQYSKSPEQVAAGPIKVLGTTVQIKMPIVATIIQCYEDICTSLENSENPHKDGNIQDYNMTAPTTKNTDEANSIVNYTDYDNLNFLGLDDNQLLQVPEVQNEYDQNYSDGNIENVQAENNVISIPESSTF